MIKSIKGIALRFFRMNKFIAWSSIVSIMLSISLIVSMAVFAVDAKQSLVNEVQKMYGNMDLSVGYNPEQNKVVDSSLLQKLTSHEKIEHFSPVLISRFQVNQLHTEVYTVGVENDSLVKSKYHFREDLDSSDVIMNQSLAEALQVGVGDNVKVESKTFMVKEVLEDLDATGLAPDLLLMPRDTVQKIMQLKTGRQNEATYLLVKAKEKTDILPIVHSVRKIDPEIRIDVAEENEFLKSNLASLNIFMGVLSVLILVVTSLLIISNYELFLYKNRNQIAIMRSMGATKKQVFRMIWLQGSFINSIGGILGFILAMASNRFVLPWFQQLFSFQNVESSFQYPVAFAVTLVGMVFIQLFMMIPAFQSVKVLPLKLIHDNEKRDFSQKKLGKRLGQLLLFSSIFFIIYAKVFKTGDDTVLPYIAAGLLFVLGIFRLFPVFLSPFLTRFLPVLRFFFGKVSYVAVKNLIPQVRKNTFIVLTISTMMIIAIFGSSLLKTIEYNEQEFLKKQYPTDLVVSSRAHWNSTVNPVEIKAAIKGMQGVKEVSTISTPSPAELNRGDYSIPLDYQLVDFKEMEKQGLLPPFSMGSQDEIVITQGLATKNKLQIGDTLELEKFSESEQKNVPLGKIVVGEILENLPGSHVEAFIDWENTTFISKQTVFEGAFIQSDDTEITLQELERLKSQYPGELQLNSYEQSLEKSKQMFFQRWSIFIAVMITMLVSVMFGVFNTLMNNIHSKRKEFAILRTISLNKREIVQVILTQVLLYLLIGLVLGILVGMTFTYILNMIDPGQVQFDYLFMFAIVGGMIGMAFVVFIPFANRIGGGKLTLELNQDNK